MQMEYLRRAVRVIARIDSPVERDVYIGKLSRELGISADSTRETVNRTRKRAMTAERKKEIRTGEQEMKGTYDRVNPERSGALRAARSEEMILALLSRHPDLAKTVREQLPPEEWITGFNRRVYEFILEEYQSNPDQPMPIFAKAFDEKEMARISFFINTPILRGDPAEQLRDCIQVIKNEGAKRVDTGALSPEDLMRRLQGKGE